MSIQAHIPESSPQQLFARYMTRASMASICARHMSVRPSRCWWTNPALTSLAKWCERVDAGIPSILLISPTFIPFSPAFTSCSKISRRVVFAIASRCFTTVCWFINQTIPRFHLHYNDISGLFETIFLIKKTPALPGFLRRYLQLVTCRRSHSAWGDTSTTDFGLIGRFGPSHS